MESVHENRGAGRARATILSEDVGRATPPRLRAKWKPVPVARPEDLIWAGGQLKQYLLNLLNDPAGPYADVDAWGRALLKELLHHRNARTGAIFPGVDRLAFELPFRARSIRYGFGRLCAGPSRQRDGKILDGWGLMWRERRWNTWGGQTSNAYGFTRKFFELAGVVLPLGEVGAGSAAPSVNAPVVTSAAQPPAGDQDQDYATFAAVFSAERSAKYSDGDAGTLGVENRARVASFVLDLTAEAYSWAKGRGLALDWSAIREDLCRRMVRAWLAMSGTSGFLDERRHPIGLIVGDLSRVGPEALAAWKRAQPKPKIHVAEPPQAPPPVLEDVDEDEPPATSAEPAEDPAEVRALCADLRAELLGRLSPLDPAAQHDAAWSTPAAPVVDELAEVRAKAAEIAARGGGEAARRRAMSVLLAEQDDPATVAMTTTVGPGEEARGRRTRASVALFLPGVQPPAEAPETKTEAEEEPEEPAQLGEQGQGASEGRSRRAPPYTPRSRRSRGS